MTGSGLTGEAQTRLQVLGQIAVVRERLAVLERWLVGMPMSDQSLGPAVADALGNLSLQMGVLVGVITLYQDEAVKK